MTMTNEQIIADFKAAKSPMKQIGILADMNCCKKQEIVEILKAAGVDLPKNYTGTRKKQIVAAPAAEPEPDPVSDELIRELLPLEPDDDTVDALDTLPLIVRHAATEAIAYLLHRSDEDAAAAEAVDFKEQVRGVLAVVHEVDRRCKEVFGDA